MPIYDETGALILGAGAGALTSPVGIADGGTGQTTQTGGFDALAPTTTGGDIIYHNGTDNVRLAAGSAGQVLTLASGIPAWKNKLDYIHIRDEKTSGTDGGTFTSGSWQTRNLNTEVSDTGGYASIASNQITLGAGTYLAQIKCPAYNVVRHRARLQNITDGTTVLLGTSEITSNVSSVSTSSFIFGLFTLAASKVLEVQHRCGSTGTTTGYGVAVSFGDVEVYTVVELIRIGD